MSGTNRKPSICVQNKKAMGIKVKIIGGTLALGVLIILGIAYYMFNMPQRDVQAAKTDYMVSSTQIVEEYLADARKANEKYLQEEGESKILAVTGTIVSITIDLNQQKVMLLKSNNDKAGVSCTFTSKTNGNVEGLTIGDKVTVKGVIRSGAGYDNDLGLYEDVILEKCALISQN